MNDEKINEEKKVNKKSSKEIDKEKRITEYLKNMKSFRRKTLQISKKLMINLELKNGLENIYLIIYEDERINIRLKKIICFQQKKLIKNSD